MSVPLLILGDSPASYTGLGRIACDLGCLIEEHLKDDFRVATYGFGDTGSRKLPFTQYSMSVSNGYVPQNFPRVWRDFAGNQKGIVLSIWNPSWLWWLGQCELLPEGSLKNFLHSKPFRRWGYFPVDGHCENGELPFLVGKTISAFDRILAYTSYGSRVIENTVRGIQIPHLPHGLDSKVFNSSRRGIAKDRFFDRVFRSAPKGSKLNPNCLLVGVIATNTPRKDWYLAFEVCQKILQSGFDVGMWAHTDALKKNWDIVDLARRFGMLGRVIPTTEFLSDDNMAWGYSACDVTLGIGSGEGWGYPLAESLACGTPVIHGNYAGGSEIVPSGMQVRPAAFRGDGIMGILRPVYTSTDWAELAIRYRSTVTGLPEYIDWKNAWPRWKEWLLRGLND